MRMSIILDELLKSENISSTRVSEIQFGLYHDQVSLINTLNASSFSNRNSLNTLCNSGI